ncbi:hypothetical protein GCM10022239_08570 [Leifsonia bigeumensis]|uniref:DUF4175 domain-containing protein n=1 Tax=Leifsonella bigeumensis TaxID=433643 RepID=A0ABP7FA93_9MICO
MPEPTGPARTAWNAVLLLFGVCLVLWFCVKLIESIWPWLLGGAMIVLLIGGVTFWIRLRRGRW